MRKIEIRDNDYNTLKQLSKKEGTDISNTISNLVRKHNPVRILKLYDTMPIGKYKGYDIHQIINIDIEYASWMLRHMLSFNFSDDVFRCYDNKRRDLA